MNKAKKENVLSFFIILCCVFGLSSCMSSPKSSVMPVAEFNSEKYLGNWYEIARFDFKWEKNMKNVRANYSLNDNGTIKVVNSGYDYVAKKNKQSVGKARFVKSNNIGDLEVSFFWPFYSDYKIIAIDPYYQYALVAGDNLKLLWILSRTPTIPNEVKADYMQIAEAAGYDLTDLVWTIQD